MKPENILIDSDGHVKLTDFGLSKDGMNEKGGLTESFCGTSEYLAPEIIKEKQYGFTVDWYSLGLVIYEMLGAMNPFKTGDDNESFVDKMNRILNIDIKMPSYFSREASDLIKKLLIKSVRT